MSIESLNCDAESELVVRTLASDRSARLWGWANEVLARHLPSGTRVLLTDHAVPVMYRDLTSTQVGSRMPATVLDWDSYNVLLAFDDGEQLWMLTEQFLDLVFDGRIGDVR